MTNEANVGRVCGFEFLLGTDNGSTWSRVRGHGGMLGNGLLHHYRKPAMKVKPRTTARLLWQARNMLERDGALTIPTDEHNEDPSKRFASFAFKDVQDVRPIREKNP